ncbi:hypothetical protein IQ276_037880 [Desmonostoc muscorum LEGE 12446]|uniref:Uncharacterized protein n=1 Tax=Desmonostoc muscorum LEGE 12446 TaxID=1828758 RepID=A0A8J6ZRE4_DESMC|nr:hypothetical protein [Desmonostoc muscorum]MCF2152072.1 hypothetical protein [Desmonostoc muscorum LEGE 12446]
MIATEEKYLTYKSASGFNNQRQSLENAILMAKELQRTLILPRVVLNNNSNINEQKQDSFAHWSVFLDIKDLQQIVKIIDMDSPIVQDVPKKYITSIGGAEKHLWIDKLPSPGSVEDIYFQKHCKIWSQTTTIRGFLKEFENDLTPILFFENLQGNDLFTYLSSEKYIFYKSLINKYIHFQKDIITKAENIIRKLGDYNSLHLRRGDFFYLLEPDVVVECLENIFLNKQNLFLATDEKQKEILQPLYQKFNIISLNNFLDEIGEITNNEIIGCIEQYICIHSKIFIGTHRSTFTNVIKQARFTMPNLLNRQVYLLSQENNVTKLKENKFNNYLRF